MWEIIKRDLVTLKQKLPSNKKKYSNWTVTQNKANLRNQTIPARAIIPLLPIIGVPRAGLEGLVSDSVHHHAVEILHFLLKYTMNITMQWKLHPRLCEAFHSHCYVVNKSFHIILTLSPFLQTSDVSTQKNISYSYLFFSEIVLKVCRPSQ